ncbi:MAG: DUF2232 domain-containing protein [Gemmatimonadales bacterium]
MAGVLAFALWAPPSLVGLPFAALIVASRPRTAGEWVAALLVGAPSVGLLILPAGGMLAALVRTYVVLVTAAFVAGALVVPARCLRQAVRASLLAGAATLGLTWAVWGAGAWEALHWEATREASWAMRLLVGLYPQAFAAFEPVVRFVSDTIPAMLVLQTLAGLALAWQWHQRVAARPLGHPLAPFREFRFGDHWVWGLVAGLAVWVTPALAALKAAALNVVVVLGALYLLRGAAIVAAFAQAVGWSTGAVLAAAAAAAVLTVPLLLLIPGLWALGVTDTWLEFRRRLAGRRAGGQSHPL